MGQYRWGNTNVRRRRPGWRGGISRAVGMPEPPRRDETWPAELALATARIADMCDEPRRLADQARAGVIGAAAILRLKYGVRLWTPEECHAETQRRRGVAK